MLPEKANFALRTHSVLLSLCHSIPAFISAFHCFVGFGLFFFFLHCLLLIFLKIRQLITNTENHIIHQNPSCPQHLHQALSDGHFISTGPRKDECLLIRHKLSSFRVIRGDLQIYSANNSFFFTGNFSGISAAREPEKQSSVQHTPGGTKPTSGDFWFTAVIFSSQKKEKKR